MMKMRKPKVNKSVAVTLSLALGLAIIVFVTMLLFNVTDFGITIVSKGKGKFCRQFGENGLVSARTRKV